MSLSQGSDILGTPDSTLKPESSHIFAETTDSTDLASVPNGFGDLTEKDVLSTTMYGPLPNVLLSDQAHPMKVNELHNL